MHNLTPTTFKTVATLSAIALAVSGCLSSNTGSDTNSDVQAPINPAFATVVNGFVQDGKSLTGVTDVNVTVAPSDQAYVVVDEDGDYTYTAVEGVVSFAIQDSVTPTTDTPLNLALIINAGAQFMETSTTLALTGPGTHDFAINLIALSDPPTGVQTGQRSLANVVDGTGTTTSAISANSGTTDAQVDIVSNTTITTTSGTPLAGNLSVDVTHLSGASEDAEDAFPGSFVATVTNPDAYNAANPSNPMEGSDGSLITATFTAITVTDAAGNAGHQFATTDPAEKPLTIKATVDPTTINPLTDAAIAAGDSLAIWSYENETRVWTFESNATVVDESGVLTVTFTTNHLSYYNLGWWGGAKCSNVKLTLVNGGDRRLQVRIQRVGGGYARTVFYKYEGDVITLNNAPRNMRVNLSVLDAQTRTPRTIVSGIPINNLCAEPKQHTVVLDPDEMEAATLRVTAHAVCQNGSRNPTPIPSASVAVVLRGKLVNDGITNSNGIANINGLPRGETYNVWVRNNANGRKKMERVEVNTLTPSVTLEVPQFCQPTTGGTGGTGGGGVGGDI